MKQWYHGEFLLPDGRMTQFRYLLAAGTEPAAVEEVQTESYKGSTVLWISTGFVPEDTSKWPGWSMNDPLASDEPPNLSVEQLPIT